VTPYRQVGAGQVHVADQHPPARLVAARAALRISGGGPLRDRRDHGVEHRVGREVRLGRGEEGRGIIEELQAGHVPHARRPAVEPATGFSATTRAN
jgi:hypothetical protein